MFLLCTVACNCAGYIHGARWFSSMKHVLELFIEWGSEVVELPAGSINFPIETESRSSWSGGPSCRTSRSEVVQCSPRNTLRISSTGLHHNAFAPLHLLSCLGLTDRKGAWSYASCRFSIWISDSPGVACSTNCQEFNAVLVNSVTTAVKYLNSVFDYWKIENNASLRVREVAWNEHIERLPRWEDRQRADSRRVDIAESRLVGSGSCIKGYYAREDDYMSIW